MSTECLSALDKVLKAGNYPYWYLAWGLKDDLDVSIIVSRIKELTDDPPVNSFALKIPSGTQLYQNASFRIGWFDGNPITVGLFRAQQNAEAQVCLIFQHPLGKGFYRAHELFTVETVLAILFGEKPRSMAHELLKQACINNCWLFYLFIALSY
jgi:hypothetical protein